MKIKRDELYEVESGVRYFKCDFLGEGFEDCEIAIHNSMSSVSARKAAVEFIEAILGCGLRTAARERLLLSRN